MSNGYFQLHEIIEYSESIIPWRNGTAVHFNQLIKEVGSTYIIFRKEIYSIVYNIIPNQTLSLSNAEIVLFSHSTLSFSDIKRTLQSIVCYAA